jgi:L-alanine-DL-glutamate epimerase-like enolase superfamily enzyme
MELKARTVTLPLAERFVISRSAQNDVELAQVELVHDGVSGFGEAAPIDRYDQTAASARAWLEQIDAGDDPWALDELWPSLPPGEDAARSALDAALHDLQGKLVRLPVWRLLGLRRDGPPTSWSVWLGDPDDMARRAEAPRSGASGAEAEARRARRLDLERVRAVRAATTCRCRST